MSTSTNYDSKGLALLPVTMDLTLPRLFKSFIRFLSQATNSGVTFVAVCLLLPLLRHRFSITLNFVYIIFICFLLLNVEIVKDDEDNEEDDDYEDENEEKDGDESKSDSSEREEL